MLLYICPNLWNVSGHWVIVMCQCRFINCNKCTTLVGDEVNESSDACKETKGVWEISVSSQFFCEPKTALKKYIFSKNKFDKFAGYKINIQKSIVL